MSLFEFLMLSTIPQLNCGVFCAAPQFEPAIRQSQEKLFRLSSFPLIAVIPFPKPAFFMFILSLPAHNAYSQGNDRYRHKNCKLTLFPVSCSGASFSLLSVLDYEFYCRRPGTPRSQLGGLFHQHHVIGLSTRSMSSRIFTLLPILAMPRM